MDWLVVLGVIGGGGLLAAWGFSRFGEAAERAAHRKRLQEIERGPVRPPDQQAVGRDAAYRWADQELERLRRERGEGR